MHIILETPGSILWEILPSFVLFIATTKLLRYLLLYLLEKHFVHDTLLLAFLRHALSGALYLLLIPIFLTTNPLLKTITYPLLASSGIIAFIGGFASQQIFANILGGLFISLTKPFVIGDSIKIIDDQIIGTVKDITLRHTVLKTNDGREILIPNSKFNNQTIEKMGKDNTSSNNEAVKK